MITWVWHVRRAVLIALAWGVAWAPLGVLTGIIVDPSDTMDEPWIALGAYPGFLCGLVFCLMLWIAGRNRRLREWPLLQVGAWGAAGGLLLMLLPFTGLLGTPNTEHAFWQWRFALVAAVTLLSAISAIASAVVVRMAKKRELGGGSTNLA